MFLNPSNFNFRFETTNLVFSWRVWRGFRDSKRGDREFKKKFRQKKWVFLPWNGDRREGDELLDLICHLRVLVHEDEEGGGAHGVAAVAQAGAASGGEHGAEHGRKVWKKRENFENYFKNTSSQGIIYRQGEFNLNDKANKILTCVAVVLE